MKNMGALNLYFCMISYANPEMASFEINDDDVFQLIKKAIPWTESKDF